MGNSRLLKILILLSVTSQSISAPQKQPPRPTRTLGSLFGGSKPTQPPQQPPQVTEQKSLNSIPIVSGSGVRPLVYQVKYYDRIQNNLIDLQSDPRNYNIEKAGVVGGVDLGGVQGQQGQILSGVQGQQQQQNYLFGQPPPVIPQRYYYNPLIPPVQEPVYYTVANIGNTQVLIPCSTPPQNELIYDSTIALNVDNQVVQQPSLRVPVQQHQPPAQSTAPQPQRTPLLPPPAIQQPQLIREQVVEASHQLSQLGTLPGGLVSANINQSPYTQGSYYYIYYLPPQQTPQIIDPQVPRIPQYPQYSIPNYYRQGYNGVPYVFLNNYGYAPHQQQYQGPVVVPQPSNAVPVRQQQGQQVVGQQSVQQVQGQTQGQQQQQQVKG